jgi:hypothetical protein
MDLYKNAHLIAAAVRLLEHKEMNAPSIEKICKELSFSIEQGTLIVRRMVDMGILDITEGAYGSRLYLRNHLALEEIPKGEAEDRFADELAKFQNARKTHSKKIETIKAEQAAKRKNLFSEIEKKLKEDLEKTKSKK